MKRSWTGLLIVLLACIPIWLQRAAGPNLLHDTDTAVLLNRLADRHSPLSWFAGDWPLQNHFYRPISTLFFEFDRLIYGTDPAGYGATNALLCIACVVASFWLAAELFRTTWAGAAAATLFAMWHVLAANFLFPLALALAGSVVLTAIVRNNWKAGLVAGLITGYAGFEAAGQYPFAMRTLDWLPGRTATSMTLFTMLALGSLFRYVNLERWPDKPRSAPMPTDPPATRTTRQTVSHGSGRIFLLLALVSSGLALGCYEQAVMLPFIVALAFSLLKLDPSKRRSMFYVVGGFTAVLLGYALLRMNLLPNDLSGYQRQQIRTISSSWVDLFHQVFPIYPQLFAAWASYSVGVECLLLPAIPKALAALAAVTATIQNSLKDELGRPALFGLGGSFLAYLPMAFLKPFEHYLYWPVALRTVWIVGIAMIAAKLCASAVSPRGLQAPQRLHPAPGSLPRR